jgi:hypothetical protein
MCFWVCILDTTIDILIMVCIKRGNGIKDNKHLPNCEFIENQNTDVLSALPIFTVTRMNTHNVIHIYGNVIHIYGNVIHIYGNVIHQIHIHLRL